MLYLKLFHGRKDPTEQMDDWGSDGPIFGPYSYIHTTYAHSIKMGLDSDTVHDLYAIEDMIYYDGMYYGDWSIFPDATFAKEDQTLHEVYDSAKAQPPKKEKTTEPDLAEPSVKIVVYVRGGMCIDVVTNLPDDSWEYSLVDYDNEPDLPVGHVPFTKGEMKTLPSMAAIVDLIRAAEGVIENWESGDLAGAVRQMAAILAQIDPVPQNQENRYTVFGYRTDLKCPFSTWVAACTVDETKAVMSQQHPTVVVCGIVKGWVQPN